MARSSASANIRKDFAKQCAIVLFCNDPVGPLHIVIGVGTHSICLVTSRNVFVVLEYYYVLCFAALLHTI